MRIAPIVVVVALVSSVSVGQRFRSHVTTKDVVKVTTERGRAGSKTGVGAGSTGRTQSVAVPPAKAGLACARGRNGGETDVGVTGTSIKLGATVVKSGIGASFLKEVPIAMEAVINEVNAAGGICGRLLELRTVDDQWKAAEGLAAIRSFIKEGKFALAVSPSSEGLDAAIRSGEIRRAGIPVVGADGMLISQYTDPWVWPVAASTITTMHVMAKNAAGRGAKTFGLIYDKDYHFGVEGAAAFRGALKRIPGTTLKQDLGVDSGQSSYKTFVNTFNSACSPCDFVAMLLEPLTALQWIRDGGSFGSIGTGGPQPLFVDSFARGCGTPCNGMWVWTGYKPPVSPFDDLPAVVEYVNTVQKHTRRADVNNPFVQGGYVGMRLLVKALQQVGPDVKRARLKAVMDSMVFDSGLTVPLSWSPGDHFANDAVQAFSIVINANSFQGWRYEQTGWIKDPWVGLDAPRQ